MTIEKVTFGAGCFWGVEAAFRRVDGVRSVTAGYCGGTTEDPTCEAVCSKRTGHAEVVQVEYDTEQVSFERLLKTFWSSHDPTATHRNPLRTRSQYRSAIFYSTTAQRAAAEVSKQEQYEGGKLSGEIQTEITAAPTFYRAEERHQRYYQKHRADSCPT